MSDTYNRVRALLEVPPVPSVDLQRYYEAVRDWALRGMGYGLGDHPSTSGERGVLEVLAQRCAAHPHVTKKTVCGYHGTVGSDASAPCPGGVQGTCSEEAARRGGPVVFDVGANTGEWAAMAMRRFGDALHLRCFEPSPSAFKILSGVVHAAPIAVLGLHPFGLSSATRSAPLHTDALGSGMASVHPRRLDHFGRDLGLEERAEFRPLDAVCRDLGVTRIDLLKIDVEGHEMAVLMGAGEMLTSGAIGMIQWEMGGCNLDSRTTFQDFWYLLHERYDIYRVVADGLVAVPAYREQDEVFVCCNMVAIWRDHGPEYGTGGGAQW